MNPLIRQNQRPLYNLLFGAASQTLLEFGRNNLGAQLGLTVVLHTWSQTLIDHYHVHCAVTGGGMALDGQSWVSTTERFLFPVAALAKVFQGKFCHGLQQLHAEGQLQFHGELSALAQTAPFQALIREATARSWNVYAKRPFAGPEQVLAYLSRYTHRVAISQRRLRALNLEKDTIRFAYKLRRDPAAPVWTEMELETGEFLRRFCLHVLPERLVKIRHYGLLANRGRQERIMRARSLLAGSQLAAPDANQLSSPSPDQAGTQPGESVRLICPYCGHRALVWVEFVQGSTARGRSPP